MTPPQHTPRPWKLEAGRCITTESGSFSVHSNADWNRNWVELDVNVKLMSEAPNLLAVLKEAVEGEDWDAEAWAAWQSDAEAVIEAAS